MKRINAAALAASALTCFLLGGCANPAARTPLQLYTGDPRQPAQTVSLLMVTEKDVTYDNTIGWVRIMSVDGVDTSTAVNHHVHVLAGMHHLTLRCRPGPRYAKYQERIVDLNEDFAANRTYVFEPELNTSAVTVSNSRTMGYGACNFEMRYFDGLDKFPALWKIK